MEKKNCTFFLWIFWIVKKKSYILMNIFNIKLMTFSRDVIWQWSIRLATKFVFGRQWTNFMHMYRTSFIFINILIPSVNHQSLRYYTNQRITKSILLPNTDQYFPKLNKITIGDWTIFSCEPRNIKTQLINSILNYENGCKCLMIWYLERWKNYFHFEDIRLPKKQHNLEGA